MNDINNEKSFPFPLTLFFLIVFVGIGIFFRFYRLELPSIWIDELNHYYVAQSIIQKDTPTLPSGEIYPRAVLYSKLVAYSFRLLGANEFSLRLPSAFFGVLCIIVAFFVAKRFFGETAALLTALFVAISPFAIGWSRLSRMYTLFQFLFMLGVYAFYRGFESDKRGVFAKWQGKVLSGVRGSHLLAFLTEWKLNLFWLLVAFIFFRMSYSVHNLTALFSVGVLFYLGFMFLLQWREQGFLSALKGKYFIVLVGSIGVAALAIVAVPPVRSLVHDSLTYIPKWAEGTRFQERKLYLDFIFDQYNFPMGTLFVLGAYQIISRLHRNGIYALSLFLGYVLTLTFVFSYRHFQYLYNVYSLFIMICAFAFSNIVGYEFDFIKRKWFSRTKLNDTLIKGIIFCTFLAWLPLTPSVRLTRRIPFSQDGSYNGAMYMEEWREACSFVRERRNENDLVISSDALGTLHYLGRVDFDLNFADLDISIEKNLKNAQGEYFDLYSGKPFIQSLAQLQQLMAENRTVWILFQQYKFSEAAVFVTPSIRDYILAEFERMLTTKNGTVVVFYYSKDKPNVMQTKLNN